MIRRTERYRRHGYHWRGEDVAQLRALYRTILRGRPYYSIEDIARDLGRTVYAIRKEASRLGLRRPPYRGRR